jgi:CheY-like chemotaxis protein
MARILVMDDDSQIRTALRETLERSGYDVVEAANGEVGIQMFCEKGADLIIADIIMPEKDGLSTIRAQYQSRSHIRRGGY